MAAEEPTANDGQWVAKLMTRAELGYSPAQLLPAYRLDGWCFSDLDLCI